MVTSECYTEMLVSRMSHNTPHTSENIAKFWLTALSHPTCSPDLAATDFNLIGPLKDGLQRHHFEDIETFKRGVWLWFTNKEE